MQEYLNENLDTAPALVQELIEHVGMERTLQIISLYGGQHLYIPKMAIADRYIRDREILKEYKEGKSYVAIARKHNMTVWGVRQIVNKKKVRYKQMPLIDS